ncbi:MAG: hypothetical protein IKM43_01280 [Clostridia bacterium]|nr:hypothetical protein [Clostridia bacterium]
MINSYVLNHEYGYGKVPEQKVLNKLMLRNIDDLKTYIQQCVKDVFTADYKNNVVYFFDNKLKTQIIIKKI